MTKKVHVLDIETNQHFECELDGDQVVSFKCIMDNVGTEETEEQEVSTLTVLTN